jgi:hypothetical protein
MVLTTLNAAGASGPARTYREEEEPPELALRAAKHLWKQNARWYWLWKEDEVPRAREGRDLSPMSRSCHGCAATDLRGNDERILSFSRGAGRLAPSSPAWPSASLILSATRHPCCACSLVRLGTVWKKNQRVVLFNIYFVKVISWEAKTTHI